MENGQTELSPVNGSPDRCLICRLAECPLKDDVEEAEAAKQTSYHNIFPVARGERLSGKQNDCHTLWVVISGFVVSATELKDGRRQITAIHTSGDLICPVGGGLASECWVEALGPGLVCEVDLRAMLRDETSNSSLIANLFRVAHKQLERSVSNLVMLGRLDGLERIYVFIGEVTRRLGRKTSAGYRVQLPMSRDEIADYLGLNAETVSRLMGRVRKSRLVTFLSPTEFIVHDLEQIAARAPTANGNSAEQNATVLERNKSVCAPCRPNLTGQT